VADRSVIPIEIEGSPLRCQPCPSGYRIVPQWQKRMLWQQTRWLIDLTSEGARPTPLSLATPIAQEKSKGQLLLEKLRKHNIETSASAEKLEEFFPLEMSALSATSAKSLAATATLAELGLAQKASVDDAVAAFASARAEQLIHNDGTDAAISSLHDAVRGMRAQLASLQGGAAQASEVPRAHKSQRTQSGKGGSDSPGRGGAAKRSASAEPQRRYDKHSCLDGDSCIVHIILPVDIVSSRLRVVATKFVRGTMPTCDFHIQARSNNAAITFTYAGSASIVVNRMFEAGDDRCIFIGNDTDAAVKYTCRVKHDEAWPIRRRQWVASRAWIAVSEIVRMLNPGEVLTLGSFSLSLWPTSKAGALLKLAQQWQKRKVSPTPPLRKLETEGP
jgi:hypothetical protein